MIVIAKSYADKKMLNNCNIHQRSGERMPLITIDGPQINDTEIKRKLVKEMTEAAVEAYKLPVESIVVLIKETLPENVSVGGQLISDRKV